jgi:DeoR family transcriptional regulator, fructose operon transcriptional repressor
MLTAERHRAILRLLAEQGRITVAQIAQRFDISQATARRDAVQLSDAGKAARAHGGLLPANFFQSEPHFRAKADRQMGIKTRLARKAAELLPHEGNVFVDAGTTCLEIGRLLIERPDLRVFTNSIPLLAHAAEARATLTGIGGEVRKVSLALTGALAQTWLSHLRFDSAVIGASGLDLATGAYTTEIHEAAIKAEVLRRSGLRMLVADAEKWNRPAAVHFAPWSAFTSVVTNHQLPREARLKLAGQNVKFCLV